MPLLVSVEWPLTSSICTRQKPTCLHFLVISATFKIAANLELPRKIDFNLANDFFSMCNFWRDVLHK